MFTWHRFRLPGAALPAALGGAFPQSVSSSQPGSKHRKLGQQENGCWAWLAALERETVDSVDLAKAKTDLPGVLRESQALEGELPLRECLLCVRAGLGLYRVPSFLPHDTVVITGRA